MFHRNTEGRMITILIVYVDDIIVTDNNVVDIGRLKGSLAKGFKIKYLENLRYFLRIDIRM